MELESSPAQATIGSFYTIGYAGMTIEAFVDSLLAADVLTLLDIRHFPGSRYRPEFSKRNLAAALEARGIRYIHNRELGIPSHIRREHGFPNHGESLWEWYDAEVVGAQVEDAGWLAELSDGPSALMCVESDPEDCHRHRLANALVSQGFGYAGDLWQRGESHHG